MLKLLHAFSESNPSPADIAQSLLFFISNDIGQLACLQAKLHNINRIYFGGFFIRGHPLTMHSISHAIKYWSQVCCWLHHLRIFRLTNMYLLFNNCLDPLVLGDSVGGSYKWMRLHYPLCLSRYFEHLDLVQYSQTNS